MWYWNKIKMRFAAQKQETAKGSKSEEQEFLVNKKLEKEFIRDIAFKNLNNSPVFLIVFMMILVANIVVFFAILAKNKIGIDKLDSRWYTLFFGANHASSVFEGKQVWRIVTYAFLENVNGLQVVIAAIFIWITFYSLGYFQEIFLGSKKTLIVWGVGVPLIGLAQLLLTKTEVVYYYGTEYLTWLSMGSLTCLLTGKMIKNEQASGMVRGAVFRIGIFLIIFAILKYVEVRNNISFDNSKLMRIGSYYITFILLSFFIGFFMTLLLNYKRMTNNIAIYGAIIFFVVLILTLIIMMVLSIQSYDIGNGTWVRLRPYY